ncbi:MAG: 4,5-DOPA dioxygenase extradiol [Eubacteriales bacterium]|nr:4,5-DOPA dioxygenase extradiol [Eubacteriales bacterium]
MPALFVGHGSPMNAIERNTFSDAWIALGEQLPKPEAILSVSAHWFTRGTKINRSPETKMVYDMYGFPDELYRVVYPAPGSPLFSQKAKLLLEDRADFDDSWGLDHGSWSVLRRLFPKADVPVFQVSVDAYASMEDHFAMGERLQALRDEGVLILGSGNIVHNLGRVDWQSAGGFPWAHDFDGYVKQAILSRSLERVIRYQEAGEPARLAVPTPDHYAPLLYVLGASEGSDRVRVFNEACVMGSLSMTGYLFESSADNVV